MWWKKWNFYRITFEWGSPFLLFRPVEVVTVNFYYNPTRAWQRRHGTGPGGLCPTRNQGFRTKQRGLWHYGHSILVSGTAVKTLQSRKQRKFRILLSKHKWVATGINKIMNNFVPLSTVKPHRSSWWLYAGTTWSVGLAGGVFCVCFYLQKTVWGKKQHTDFGAQSESSNRSKTRLVGHSQNQGCQLEHTENVLEVK